MIIRDNSDGHKYEAYLSKNVVMNKETEQPAEDYWWTHSDVMECTDEEWQIMVDAGCVLPAIT